MRIARSVAAGRQFTRSFKDALSPKLEKRERSHRMRVALTRLAESAIENIAPWIESDSPINDDGTRVEEVATLDADSLGRLLRNETLGLVVRGYYPEPSCHELLGWIREQTFNMWPVAGPRGVQASDMAYLGYPESVADIQNKLDEYWERSLGEITKLREGAGGLLSPIDKLRLDLDENWKFGSNLRREKENAYFAGVIRALSHQTLRKELEGMGLCHCDSRCCFADREDVFTANTYLEVPASGGELELWPVAPGLVEYATHMRLLQKLVRSDYADLDTQKLLRARMPAPTKIKPERGDLILFNTSRPHCVVGFDKGQRITCQTFMLSIDGHPLQLFV